MNGRKQLIYSAILAIALLGIVITYFLFFHSGNESLSSLPNSDQPIDCYSILLDDSYVFFSLSENSSASFYRQPFNGSRIKIGEIPDYIFNLGFHTLIGDKLFFYVTTAESTEAVFNENAYTNHIYCIDLSKNKLYEEYSESICLPGAIISSSSTLLISRQSRRSADNMLSTYLEIYDPESHKIVEVSESFVLNDTTNIGAYMMNACSDNQYIYALVDNRYEGGNSHASIIVYNQNFDVIKEIKVDSIEEYILSSRVAEMSITGNYLYMKNYSGNAVVALIEDSYVTPIIQKNGLQKAIQYHSEHPIFYSHGESDVYLYDESSGEFLKKELNLIDNYLIKHIMINENSALVTLFAYASSPDDIVPDKIIYTDISSIHQIR